MTTDMIKTAFQNNHIYIKEKQTGKRETNNIMIINMIKIAFQNRRI